MELIHTCYRITDPDGSVGFYEPLGFEERRRMPIRDEAINIFMLLPGDGDRLELTYNFGVDSYELGTGYGHVAVTVDDIHATLARLADQGIEPENPPYTVREGGICLQTATRAAGGSTLGSNPGRPPPACIAVYKRFADCPDAIL
jgi:lactoylglutathione lyase